MRIAVVGCGYVGLVAGACLAEAGHDVVLIDVDPDRIEAIRAGRAPFAEPELDELLSALGPRIRATTDWSQAHDAEVVLLAVPTPALPDGSADLTALWAAADALEPHLGDAVVAVKSTVPVGTTARLAERLGVPVAANPEFLRQGRAVADFRRPDRIVVGSQTSEATTRLRALYEPFVDEQRPFVACDPASAELAKYAANATLAMRVAWIDSLADLADALHADIDAVRTVLGHDPRIGSHYLAPGPGYGGACFPKDVPALAHQARAARAALSLAEATEASNRAHREHLVARVFARIAGIPQPIVAIWGLAFKAGADDLRGALGPELVLRLADHGVTVKAWDPAVSTGDETIRASTPLEAAAGADLLVVLTAEPALSDVDPAELAAAMRGSAVEDLRNALDGASFRSAGLDWRGLGRR